MTRVAALARSIARPFGPVKIMLRPTSDRMNVSGLVLRGLRQVNALRTSVAIVGGLKGDSLCYMQTSKPSAM